MDGFPLALSQALACCSYFKMSYEDFSALMFEAAALLPFAAETQHGRLPTSSRAVIAAALRLLPDAASSTLTNLCQVHTFGCVYSHDLVKQLGGDEGVAQTLLDCCLLFRRGEGVCVHEVTAAVVRSMDLNRNDSRKKILGAFDRVALDKSLDWESIAVMGSYLSTLERSQLRPCDVKFVYSVACFLADFRVWDVARSWLSWIISTLQGSADNPLLLLAAARLSSIWCAEGQPTIGLEGQQKLQTQHRALQNCVEVQWLMADCATEA